MTIKSKDLLFAGLMGYKNVALIERANLVQNELSKKVLPPIPFLPVQNDVNVNEASSFNLPDKWTTNDNVAEQKQFFPLSFSFTENGQKWLFPFEPMLNISTGNNLIKRNVAKQGDKLIGTVKERWNRKDIDITVTGVLMGALQTGSAEDCFPKQQFIELFEFLKYNREIYVYSFILEKMGITKVVVEDYSFPFTKGENVQAYDIKLVSDFDYELLIKEDF